MNILIQVGYQYFTVPAEHTTAMAALLPHIRAVTVDGFGDATTYKLDPLPPKAEFIDSDKLAPFSAREEALAKALAEKNTQWLGAFTERDKEKARVRELEDEVKRLKAGIVSPDATAP